jgi:signal peptidase II
MNIKNMQSRFMLTRSIISIVIIAFLVVIDQFSKTFFIQYLTTQPDYMIRLSAFLDIVYAWNYGISFGLFSQYKEYSNGVFLVFNSLIVLYLWYIYIVDAQNPKLFLLIISGGIGNLMDRVIRGAVFDFIDFHYGGYHFPAFNVADSLISIGIFLFILEFLFAKKAPKL